MPSAPLPGLSLLLPRAPVQGWALVPAVRFFLKGGASCRDLLNPGKSLNGERDPWVPDSNFSENLSPFPLPPSFPNQSNFESRPALAHVPSTGCGALGQGVQVSGEAQGPSGTDPSGPGFCTYFGFFFSSPPPTWVRPTQLKLWQSLLSHEFIL